MANIITGLDIGTSSIKGVVVSKKKGGALSVISAFQRPSAGVRDGILVDPEEALKVLREVVMDLEKVSKKAAQNIFVSVNGQYIKPKFSQGNVSVSRADQEIQQDDVDRVLQDSRTAKLDLADYIILHNINSEFFVDDVGDIRDPVGMAGHRLRVSTLIIQIFNSYINRLINILKKAGGKVAGAVFAPLAAGQAVLSKRQKELGVLLIDFGGGTTSLAIYKKGKVIYSKSLPVGSEYVTNDIAIGFRILIDTAEKLKKEYGYAVSKKVSRKDKIDLLEVDASVGDDELEISHHFLSEIIQVRLEEILGLINSELREIGGLVQLPAGVVMCGGGMKIGGIDDLVKKELKLPVQIGYPQTDDLEVINPTHRELVGDPEFATAIGLALWGSGKVAQPLSPTNTVKMFLKNFMP